MKRRLQEWIIILVCTGALLAMAMLPEVWDNWAKQAFPGITATSYPNTTLLQLLEEHLLLVGSSSLIAVAMGIGLGIYVTRPGGREYLETAHYMSAIAQTFPPVAVIALAVPAMGFGYKPTILALFLYGILPVLKNTIAGLEDVSPDLIEAAQGLGMSPIQVLRRVELPLALNVIVGGIRTSVIVNIGTATVGAAFGAGGLGAPIIAGLVRDNPALILQGAVPVALMAISADLLLAQLERSI